MKIRNTAAMLLAFLAACGTADDPGVVTVLGYTVTIKTGPPLDALIGTAVPIAFTVSERRSDGTSRPASGQNITVEVTAGSGRINSVTLVNLTSGDDGSVSMVWTMGQFPGTQTLRGTVTGHHLDVSVMAIGRPGSELGVVTSPSATGQVGVTLAQQPRIQIQDANHNPVATAGIAVNVGISTGGSISGGPLTVITDANGVAAFSGLTLSGPANQNVTLTFAAILNGLPAQVIASPTVLAPGPAARLVVKGGPSPYAHSGIAFTAQPVIEVQDIGSNKVAQSGVVVTALIGTGTGTLAGSTTAVTDASGSATFTDLAVTGASAVITLRFNTTFSGQPSTVTSGPVNVGAWANKAPMVTARLEPASGVVGNTLYVVGGTTAADVALASVEAYTPATNTWATKAPMPTSRSSLGVGVVNGILYAVGGRGANNAALATVEAYDPLTNTWTTKAPMPTARSEFSVTVIDGILYAVGGYSYITVLDKVEAYDPVTNTWTTRAPLPVARFGHASASLSGQIYMMGGMEDPYDYILWNLTAYNPVTNSWTDKAELISAVELHGAGVINGILYAVGGRGFNAGAMVQGYNPATNSWSLKQAMPIAREQLTVAVIGGVLYAIGGTSGTIALASMDAFVP